MLGPGVSDRIPDKAAALRLMRTALALREKLLLRHPVTTAAEVAPRLSRLLTSLCSFPEPRIGAVADPGKSARPCDVPARGWRQQSHLGAQLGLMVSLVGLLMA